MKYKALDFIEARGTKPKNTCTITKEQAQWMISCLKGYDGNNIDAFVFHIEKVK